MDTEKIISALLAFLIAVFWRWVSSIDSKNKEIQDEIKEIKRELADYVPKEDLKEIKTLIKELQKDINRIRFEDRRERS